MPRTCAELLRPFQLVFQERLADLSRQVEASVVRTPTFKSVNDAQDLCIMAKSAVLPHELIQHDFTPERVAAEVRSLLEQPERREAMKRDLDEVRRRLGQPGASGRAAAASSNDGEWNGQYSPGARPSANSSSRMAGQKGVARSPLC